MRRSRALSSLAIVTFAGLAFTACGEERIIQFGTSGEDSAGSVAADGNGNVYVVGGVSGALPGQASAGGSDDAFIRKYDASGAEVWTRQFGSAGDDVAGSVSVDASGNVYVSGIASAALPGQTNAGAWDVFLRKYDSSGTELWTREFGSIGYDTGASVGADARGNVIVAGFTQAGLPGQPLIEGTAGAGFARKYDSSGNELWTLQFTGSGQFLTASATVDANGNVYFHGSTDGAFPGQTNAGSSDAYVRKYDSSGAEVWTRQFGTSSTDNALSVGVDASGSVYVAGLTFKALPGQTSAGAADAFIRKYDAAGTELWTRQFGTVNVDTAMSVTVSATGIVYVSGTTAGTLPGQTSAGGTDVFIRKYDSSGVELGTRQFGTAGIEQDIRSTLDGNKSLYVVGLTNGTFAGQANSTVNAGFFDVFLAKLAP